MRRRQSLRDRHARRPRIHFVRRLRPAHLNLVRRVRIAGLQFRAMHLHRPLEIRILVHLVRPHRRIQLQPAHHGNHFLPVRHAPHAGNQRNSHARRRLEMFRPKRRPAAPANHRRKQARSSDRLQPVGFARAAIPACRIRSELPSPSLCRSDPSPCELRHAMPIPRSATRSDRPHRLKPVPTSCSAPHSGHTYASSPSGTKCSSITGSSCEPNRCASATYRT